MENLQQQLKEKEAQHLDAFERVQFCETMFTWAVIEERKTKAAIMRKQADSAREQMREISDEIIKLKLAIMHKEA